MANGEPKVSGADVARLLKLHVREDQDAEVVALKASCSPRTVWRRLEADTDWLDLKDADDILTAVGETINDCHLKMPDGQVEEPWCGE